MDSKKYESSGSKTMLGISKASHVISTSSTSIIRIVHVIEPKLIKTDPANFRALVQKLTGRHSKSSSRSSLKKSRKNMMNSSEISYTGEQKGFSDDNLQPFCRQKAGQKDFLGYLGISGASFAQVKSESVEDSMKTCDKFSRPFGGFAELDLLATQLDSGSMQSELHILDDPTVIQTDTHSGIIKTSAIGGGFSSFL
ncbi:hypothetical protein SUGI_0422480 [Cryptomeria japonica]|nr:hypothetical protein SUGI_0422480 [Cryptomeria japonica]